MERRREKGEEEKEEEDEEEREEEGCDMMTGHRLVCHSRITSPAG